MREMIQHLVFPGDDAPAVPRRLYYLGNSGTVRSDSGKKRLCGARFSFMDFATYRNGFPLGKWKTYTGIGRVTLELVMRGFAEVTLVGYRLSGDKVRRTVLQDLEVNQAEIGTFTAEFPESDAVFLGFELSCLADVEIYGGGYAAEFPEGAARDVSPAVVVSTFRREEYAAGLLEQIRTELDAMPPEDSKGFRVLAVDNGESLKEEDLPGDGRFSLLPNRNAGSAGAVARGLMECLRMNPAPSHVLLLQDDISLMRDGLCRLAMLLKHLEPRYGSCWIGGAMLSHRERTRQLEDAFTIATDGSPKALKPQLELKERAAVLRNERVFPGADFWQSWRFCCMPLEAVRQNGLPLPLFLRWDDVEYGLRSGAQIITMGGIGAWYRGRDPYNAAVSIYQEVRNMLITRALYGRLRSAGCLARCEKIFRAHLLMHDYAGGEMVLQALEDYMRGPEILTDASGEDLLREKESFSDEMLPLRVLRERFPEIDFDKDPEKDARRTLPGILWYRLTYGGNRLWPDALMSDSPAHVPADDTYTPGKMTFRRNCIAVDPAKKAGCVRTLDRERFRELMSRKVKDMARLRRHDEEIMKAYMDSMKGMISEEFWRMQLGMDET